MSRNFIHVMRIQLYLWSVMMECSQQKYYSCIRSFIHGIQLLIHSSLKQKYNVTFACRQLGVMFYFYVMFQDVCFHKKFIYYIAKGNSYSSVKSEKHIFVDGIHCDQWNEGFHGMNPANENNIIIMKQFGMKCCGMIIAYNQWYFYVRISCFHNCMNMLLV